MMRFIVFAAGFISCLAYGGGTIGGGSGSLALEDMLELAHVGYGIQDLPKAYVDVDTFRRTQARLSVPNSRVVPVLIDGQELEVKKFGGGIVDLKVSKELLPRD